jgi:hypothetical protein
MAKYLPVLILGLAGLAALNPGLMSWAYIGAVFAFEIWLVRRVASVARLPVPVGEPPYLFSGEEAELVGRYRFYFTYPALARSAASILAAIGLTALLLAPWLTFRHALVQAVLVGINLFAVARFTKLVAPQLALRVAASRGDRAALRMLEVHDPLWTKIHTANNGVKAG